MSATRKIILAGAALLALAVAGCDNGPSAVAQKPTPDAEARSYSDASAYSNAPRGDREGDRAVDHRNDPVKQVDGKPMWSASRRYSAEENAQRAFDRNGADFGARDIDTFVRKAHAFVESPPTGTQTLTRRNGDTLFYDPKGNVFAVASKDGAPRTMFKPREGSAYWDEQKARETRRTASRRERNDDDA